MFVGLLRLTSNHLFGSGNFWANHLRNFWKIWNCPPFTREISKFSKMHSGNLSQIFLPNMWLLVPIGKFWPKRLTYLVKQKRFNHSIKQANKTSKLPKYHKVNFTLSSVSRPVSLKCHWVKSVRIRSYSGPYFPAFSVNTDRYSVSLRIQSECGKMRTRITPNTNTFYAMISFWPILPKNIWKPKGFIK